MRTEQTEILQEAICKYGFEAQMDMCVEECAELIQAINKLKRSKLTIYGGKIPNCWDAKNILMYHNLCSEVADVKIMIAQMEIMLNPEAIQITIDRKIERLSKRLNTKKL